MEKCDEQKVDEQPPQRESGTDMPSPPSDLVPRSKGGVRSFLHRNQDELLREGILGLLLGLFLAIVAFLLAAFWDSRAADRQEMLENTRFVRQLSVDMGDIDQPKPFQRMQLRGAQLAGLRLTHADFGDADLREASLQQSRLPGADLTRADLTRADLTRADLTGARLNQTSVSGADFSGAILVDAVLWEADLSGADLTGAALVGAFLAGADLTGADLTDICYDESTAWPVGFSPPASRSNCQSSRGEDP